MSGFAVVPGFVRFADKVVFYVPDSTFTKYLSISLSIRKKAMVTWGFGVQGNLCLNLSSQR
jgi:hypothetical protein